MIITRFRYCSPTVSISTVFLCVCLNVLPLRLTDYLPEESKAILTSHHASVQYQVSIQTTFVEPFDPIIGAQYIVLGELEKSQGMSVFSLCIFFFCSRLIHDNQTTQRSCLFCFQGTVKPSCVHGSLIVWTASTLHCYRRP